MSLEEREWDDFGQDSFNDELAYDIILTIFLYCPGVRTVSSLQKTCKRCHEIAKEEDFVWKTQMRGFYPELESKISHNNSNSHFFVGYYFTLRSHVSAKKIEALSRLVNLMVQDSNYSSRLSAEDKRALLNSGEISLRGGHCCGPAAATTLVGLHGKLMLDSLDLTGQMIRAEGLSSLASAAAQGNLPFLKTLGLRQNKLGGSNDNCKKTNGSLQALLHHCSSLQCLDLSENNIAGLDAVKNLFYGSSSSSSSAAIRIPSKLWLNQNHLGTTGAGEILNIATAQMNKANQSLLSSGSHHGNVAPPTLLALQCVGVGFDHTSVSGASEAKRSSVADCVKLISAIKTYLDAFLPLASHAAQSRLDTRRGGRGGGKTRKTNTALSTATTGANSKEQQEKLLKETSVECYLMLNLAPSVHSPPLQNAFSKSVQKEIEEKQPSLKSQFGISNSESSSPTSHFENRTPALAVLNVGWPKWDGAEPSGGCCVC